MIAVLNPAGAGMPMPAIDDGVEDRRASSPQPLAPGTAKLLSTRELPLIFTILPLPRAFERATAARDRLVGRRSDSSCRSSGAARPVRRQRRCSILAEDFVVEFDLDRQRDRDVTLGEQVALVDDHRARRTDEFGASPSTGPPIAVTSPVRPTGNGLRGLRPASAAVRTEQRLVGEQFGGQPTLQHDGFDRRRLQVELEFAAVVVATMHVLAVSTGQLVNGAFFPEGRCCECGRCCAKRRDGRGLVSAATSSRRRTRRLCLRTASGVCLMSACSCPLWLDFPGFSASVAASITDRRLRRLRPTAR